jgi:hypothetical protein
MKKGILTAVFILIVLLSCKTTTSKGALTDKTLTTQKDTIRIANDSLQYEVVIIDPGFNTWLNSRALPRNYYSQVFLENKNRIYINEWNNRVLQPMKYNPNLYLMLIDYNQNVNYGYEVNYLIYNYMIYFQNTYKQKLDGYVPMR